ncbi:MAG TPA: MBL fold metallo-hydrolase [Gammaproteobacteria bacterium]
MTVEILCRKPAGERLARMQASPQYRDGRFVNTYAPEVLRTGKTPSLTEFIFGGEGRKPKGRLPVVDPRGSWAAAPESGLRATWLGHSSVLLEIDGCRILTDPVWGARVSPLPGIGPKRFQAPPVDLASLPKLDAVLVSHDHYDHLDYPTIRALAKTGVRFVTSLGVGLHLEAWGVPPGRIVELDWWERTQVGALEITAAPAHHFSGRALHDRQATLWSSFALRGPRHAVFFSGDTGLSSAFRDIGARLGPFDLVMLEVGAFHPSWGSIHLGPENALKAWKYLGSGRLLPIHWGMFSLALHPWAEPAETLFAQASQGLVMPRLGEPVEPARAGAVEPWWRATLQTGARGCAWESLESLLLPVKD